MVKKESVLKLIILSLVLLVVFMPFTLRVIYAEDPLPTESPLATVLPSSDPTASASEESSPTPSDLPTPDVIAQSGDTTADSETDTLTNTNLDNLENTNVAMVTADLTSESVSGDVMLEDASGSVEASSGDASSANNSANLTNTNILSVPPDASPASVGTSNENEGVVTNDIDIDSQSGDLGLEGSYGGANLASGDTLALINLLNLLNVNLAGSDFELVLANLLQGGAEIDLNQVWDKVDESQTVDYSTLLAFIQNQNQATLVNNVDLQSTSGDIKAENVGETQASSGDATALANIANLVNLNVLGSKFVFAYINIFGSQTGDIILPNPENFLLNLSGSLAPSVNLDNNNQAVVNNNLQVEGKSGDIKAEEIEGNLEAASGDVNAQSNVYSLVNLNLVQNNWFFLIINRLGKWTGSIVGWQPGQSETQTQVSQLYLLGSGQNQSPELSDHEALPPEFTNNNQAYVENNLNLGASSGDEQIKDVDGNADLTTGKVTAIANLLNMVNLNILGGHWFLGVVNVLSDWTGNVVFAYPDLVASLSSDQGQVAPGSEYSYTLSYQNQGRDKAVGVSVALELPEGVSYLANSSGMGPSVIGRSYLWQVGDLEAGGGGSLTIKVKIDDGFSFEEKKVSFWPKIIKEVGAESFSKETDITALAKIEIQSQESDNTNNYSSATTKVVEDSGYGLGDQRQPVLEITAKNNVNGFVYQGDTVSFEVMVKNVSDVPAYKTYLIQSLFNSSGSSLGQVQINIGTLPPNRSARVTFGVNLANREVIKAGSYYTVAQIIGQAENGNAVYSNEARTSFNVKAKGGLVSGDGSEKQKVLGAVSLLSDQGGGSLSFLSKYEKYLPYVLALSVVSYFMILMAKRKLKGRTLLPIPAIALNFDRKNKLFRNMAVKIASLASLFFSLLIIAFKYLHKN